MQAEIQMRTPLVLAHKICEMLDKERRADGEEKILAAGIARDILKLREFPKMGLMVDTVEPNGAISP